MSEWNGISVNNNDKARAILLKRFSPMDGIGQDLRGITSYEEAMSKAKLDYTVEKKPLFLENGKRLENNYANVIAETDSVLSVMGKDYTILNNMEAFRVAEDIVSKGEGTYETGGPSIGAKKTIDYGKSFLIVRHDDFQIFDDSYNSFTIFNNSFDGSSGFQAYFANLRLCCMNGVVRYFANMSKKVLPKFYIQHSKNAEQRLKVVGDMLQKQRDYLACIAKEAEILATTKFSKSEFQKEIIPMVLKEMKLIKENKEENEERQRGQGRIEETILRLTSAYEASDVQNFNNTAYKVLLTMADFESHNEPFRNTNNPQIYFNRLLQGMVLTNVAVNHIIKTRNIMFNR